MNAAISDLLRKSVAQRAGYCCEYCKVSEEDSFLAFQIDHIISQKHGGGNELENLAYACPHCNQYKGTDLTTFLDSYQDIVSLFNPRIHHWFEHFDIEYGAIIGKTKIGHATVKLLKFNQLERLMHRQLLTEMGRYP